MAGGKIGDSDFSYDEITGYETGLSDVDGHAYFAKALAWAKANGIMGNNGAALDGTGKITRAQVAAMAVNYQPENLTGFVRNDKGEMVKPSI